MRREKNKSIFRDTEKLCRTNPKLKDAVRFSTDNQELILESDAYSSSEEPRYAEKAKLVISKKKTFEAAEAYKKGGMKIAVHNFASATNPGGGVVNGSSAQEECLCRCSGLYFSLDTREMWDNFYTPHRNSRDAIHNDDCIYTPDVYVFKSDDDWPELMPEDEWYKVDVITCAAPNLREVPSNRMNPGDGDAVSVFADELMKIHEKRLKRILDIAKNHEVDVIILGAFGCGAFCNDPNVVSKAMKKVIDEYIYDFKTIEFAVYCPPYDDTNYRIFKKNIGE